VALNSSHLVTSELAKREITQYQTYLHLPHLPWTYLPIPHQRLLHYARPARLHSLLSTRTLDLRSTWIHGERRTPLWMALHTALLFPCLTGRERQDLIKQVHRPDSAYWDEMLTPLHGGGVILRSWESLSGTIGAPFYGATTRRPEWHRHLSLGILGRDRPPVAWRDWDLRRPATTMAEPISGRRVGICSPVDSLTFYTDGSYDPATTRRSCAVLVREGTLRIQVMEDGTGPSDVYLMESTALLLSLQAVPRGITSTHWVDNWAVVRRARALLPPVIPAPLRIRMNRPARAIWHFIARILSSGYHNVQWIKGHQQCTTQGPCYCDISGCWNNRADALCRMPVIGPDQVLFPLSHQPETWEFSYDGHVWTGPVRWMLSRIAELWWWQQHPLAMLDSRFHLSSDGLHLKHDFPTPISTRFAWQLRTRTLATCVTLHRRGVIGEPTCWLCLQEPETVEHCFLDCRALAVWRAGFPPLPQDPLHALAILSGMGPKDTRLAYPLARKLWLQRCQAIHYLRKQRGLTFRGTDLHHSGDDTPDSSDREEPVAEPRRGRRRRVDASPHRGERAARVDVQGPTDNRRGSRSQRPRVAATPLAEFLTRRQPTTDTPDAPTWQRVGQALQAQTQRRMTAWQQSRRDYLRAYQAGLPPEQRPSVAAPPGMTRRQRKRGPLSTDQGQTTLHRFFGPPEQRPRPPDAAPL
jgi:hypothetical protein